MKCKIWGSSLLFVFFVMFTFTVADEIPVKMSKAERSELKEEARDMFYHAYRAYMENAYPADELMPLSCKGRYRGVTPNRGDMDDILGNFSLTLVDSLDTLVILGDFEEFEDAVKLVIRDVSFDKSIVVSVFETNIRMLGGLLSAHILATGLQVEGDYMTWYRGELLDLAHDLGKRLLPAFNTSTGIPHARINLRYGMRGIDNSRETCTACAGTMILEMAALSRLTGDPVFEKKAHLTMDRLWKIRHSTSDLMGTVVNVHSGDWIRKNSGVGAGIDSYYEYCLKAYILLGDEKYLARFYRHYNAVMKYISRGPMMLDVHMHRPHTQSRHFMDALLAFWPGLQVLLGDVRPAIETHEMLYQVMQRHTFIPEAFTADFQVHWGQHPLRPEFLESTYFLHRATGDDHYLNVGKAALKSLQKHARVPCGYAAMNDVRTRVHEDRMDSFVLAETFKYLYMLFADDSDIPINLDEYIMTTEAHLLPLTLADNKNNSTVNVDGTDDDHQLYPYSRTCPNTQRFLPESFRRPVRNMLGECRSPQTFRRLLARQFRPGDPDHVSALADMGISVLTLKDGRVQLLQTFSTAKSAKDAEEGLIFLREMAELLDKSTSDDGLAKPLGVAIISSNPSKILAAGPAHFGLKLQGEMHVIGELDFAKPLKACSSLVDVTKYKGKIVVAERGDCPFLEKVRILQKEGAIGVIITDNVPGSSYDSSPFFAMSGDFANDITIPAAFVFSQDADRLAYHLMEDSNPRIVIGEYNYIKENAKDYRIDSTMSFGLKKTNSEEVTSNTGPKLPIPFLTKIDSSEKDVLIRRHWLESIISELETQILFVKDRKETGSLRTFEDSLNSVSMELDATVKGVLDSQSPGANDDVGEQLKKHLEIISDRMGSIETINKLLKESYTNIATSLLDDGILSDKTVSSVSEKSTEKDDIVIGAGGLERKVELILNSYLLAKQDPKILNKPHIEKSKEEENVSVNSNILDPSDTPSQHTSDNHLNLENDQNKFLQCPKKTVSFLTLHRDPETIDTTNCDDSILQSSGYTYLNKDSDKSGEFRKDTCKDCQKKNAVLDLVEEFQVEGPTR